MTGLAALLEAMPEMAAWLTTTAWKNLAPHSPETCFHVLMNRVQHNALPISLGRLSTTLKRLGPQYVAYLLAGLDSDSAAVIETCAHELGRTGDRRAVQPLLQLLSNVSINRTLVVEALLNLDAGDRITSVYESADQGLRRFICEGMRKCGWVGDPAHHELYRALQDVEPVVENHRVEYMTPVRAAVQNGDLEKVKLLIEGNCALVLSQDRNGNTLLHYAAGYGFKNVAEFLLDNKAEVNARADDGSTPLHQAADKGHRDVAELLLAYGAKVNARDNYDETPLSLVLRPSAASLREFGCAGLVELKDKEWRHKGVAELLHKHGGTVVDSHEINAAARAGDLKRVTALLDSESDLVSYSDLPGFTPLHEAVSKGQRDVAEVLLSKGADVHARSKSGATPLHVAAVSGYTDLAEVLLDEGADVNARDGNGHTPLQWVRNGQDAGLAELLRQNGGHE